jgi:hypothetical protein
MDAKQTAEYCRTATADELAIRTRAANPQVRRKARLR